METTFKLFTPMAAAPTRPCKPCGTTMMFPRCRWGFAAADEYWYAGGLAGRRVRQ